MSRLICCLILIGACIYGRTLIVSHYAVSYSDVAYSISMGDNLPGYKKYLYQVLLIYNGASKKAALPMKF